MKIAIVGGIYSRDAAYRANHRHTPETILAAGLRTLGHEVSEHGHHHFVPDDSYDIIHVHHVGRAAWLMACSRTRARFVFTGHDGRMINGFERSILRKLAFRLVASRCDAAVALGGLEARYLRERAGARQVATILNGIPSVYSLSAEPQGSAGRGGVLFVGQLIPLKGVETLLRAFATLSEEEARTLTLVYQNPADEPSLQKLAGTLGISGRVVFAGPKSPEQLARLYASAAVFALPSHAEALPSVITEAMLAGTAIVATGVGAIPDQLGPYGEVVTPGDSHGLAAALRRTLAAPPDDATRKAMRAHALSRSSPEAMAGAHQRLYQALLAQPPARAPALRLFDPPLRAAIAVYWGHIKAHIK